MARFSLDPNRLNFSIVPRGKEYRLRLQQRAQTLLNALLRLLPSNYVSTVAGPNYTLELKAVSVELARIELALEDVNLDIDFEHTRSEFLYSVVGYLVFLNGRLPPLETSDTEFRQFLLNLIRIYFQGSVPQSIRDAADLFLSGDFVVLENFLLTRARASGLDISDQFGFQISVTVTGPLPPETFQIQSAIQIVLDIIRPAHTLFRIRYIFHDHYDPNSPAGRILDSMRWGMSSYYYEDYRSYWKGLKDVDRLGSKQNQMVSGENHSGDF